MKIHRSQWLCFAVLVISGLMTAQSVPVVPVPYPQFVSYLQNGQPNAFGCVFTFQANTSTPLATYTDGYSGTLNPDPVPLSAGGTASIWLQVGTLYTLVIKSFGGINCASGSTLYQVNGLGGGATTQTVVVPYSVTPSFTASAQNTLFQITLVGDAVSLPLATVGLLSPAYITFQITQDATGGRSFTWPTNMIGGALIGPAPNQVTTQEFIWNGTTATALGPGVTGVAPGLAAALATGNIVAHGTITALSFPSPTLVGATETGTTVMEAFTDSGNGAIGGNLLVTGSSTLGPVFANFGATVGFSLNQVATGNFAGFCQFVAATTCSKSFGHTYANQPLVFLQPFNPGAVTFTLTSVSGTGFTITASTSNSLSVQWLVIGNPN